MEAIRVPDSVLRERDNESTHTRGNTVRTQAGGCLHVRREAREGPALGHRMSLMSSPDLLFRPPSL